MMVKLPLIGWYKHREPPSPAVQLSSHFNNTSSESICLLATTLQRCWRRWHGMKVKMRRIIEMMTRRRNVWAGNFLTRGRRGRRRPRSDVGFAGCAEGRGTAECDARGVKKEGRSEKGGQEWSDMHEVIIWSEWMNRAPRVPVPGEWVGLAAGLRASNVSSLFLALRRYQPFPPAAPSTHAAFSDKTQKDVCSFFSVFGDASADGTPLDLDGFHRPPGRPSQVERRQNSFLVDWQQSKHSQPASLFLSLSHRWLETLLGVGGDKGEGEKGVRRLEKQRVKEERREL